MLIIGAHMSIAGGLVKTARNVVNMQANTMQIFSGIPEAPGIKNTMKRKEKNFRESEESTGLARCLPMRRIR